LTHWERRSPRPIAYSLIAHLAAVFLLGVFFSNPVVRKWAAGSVSLIIPVDVMPQFESLKNLEGRGGGGLQQPLPASQGRTPRFTFLQIAPPAVTPPNPNPILAVEPTLIGPADAVPPLDFSRFGNPLSSIGPPSSGPGRNGGIGNGDRGGIGDDAGPGLGQGPGMGGVYRVGVDGVSAPQLMRRVEPEYSEQARKAKWQGVVKLQIEVWPDGRAHNIRVLRSLGMGLDERAVEAVSQWTFRPGMRDGKPVRTFATVEVNFRLL
jgi:TonB family protein